MKANLARRLLQVVVLAIYCAVCCAVLVFGSVIVGILAAAENAFDRLIDLTEKCAELWDGPA